MNILIIINDAPYGTEKAFNALRLATQAQKDYPESRVTVFLMADAVGCALPGQKTPDGYYNIERMLKSVTVHGGAIRICTSCVEARGLKEAKFVDGAELSTMKELTRLVMESDRVVTF